MAIADTRHLRYDCRENDNHFLMVMEDGDLDELHIGDELKCSWTVIGFRDLQRGLALAGYTLQPIQP